MTTRVRRDGNLYEIKLRTRHYRLKNSKKIERKAEGTGTYQWFLPDGDILRDRSNFRWNTLAEAACANSRFSIAA